MNCEVRKLAVISEQVAKHYNLKFVPLQNKFDDASSDGDTRYWSVNGIHPTSAGHQKLKKNYKRLLKR